MHDNIDQCVAKFPSKITDGSRRKWFSTFLASLGALTMWNSDAPGEIKKAPAESTKKSSLSPQVVEMYSPKDGFVVDVSSRYGAIRENELICSIDTAAEERTREKTQLASELLSLEANWLKPDQIKLRRRPLEIGVEITNKYVEFAKAKFDLQQRFSHDAHKRAVIGTIDLDTDKTFALEVKRAETALYKAKSEKEKAELSLSAFDFNIEQMKSRLELVSAQLPKEEAYINSRIERLHIRAPVSGEITLVVVKGSFVGKGTKIAQIRVKEE